MGLPEYHSIRELLFWSKTVLSGLLTGLNKNGWEEEVLRRFHLRRMVGMAAIAAGALIIVVFVPSWVWYIILAALLSILLYNLWCLYL